MTEPIEATWYPCPAPEADSCPFCGRSAGLNRWGADWWVECGCGSSGPHRWIVAEAIAAWNRRTPPAPGYKTRLNESGHRETRPQEGR